MKRAVFRYYAELNDFLPPERRMRSFVHEFIDAAAVKDVVEGHGVPHTEVDLIVVNGEPAEFGYVVKDGDRIAVYPMFESFDIGPLTRPRPRPLRVTRFVLDTHLGRLAAYLRMLGFDTLYRNDAADRELAAASREQARILLTRDVGLLKRAAVTRGYFVRETDSRRQLREAALRFDLAGSAAPFTRCMHCNGLLEAAARTEIADRIPPGAREHFDEYRVCRSCGRVYWKGGHYRRMLKLVEEALS